MGSNSDRVTIIKQFSEVLSPKNPVTLSITCWNSLLEAGMPQLVVEILVRELKNMENVSHSERLFLTLSSTCFPPMSQGNSSHYLSSTLAAACQFLKKSIADDDQSCLRTFINQLDPIVKATWISRQYLEGDLTTWSLLGELLSLLGKETFKSRYDLILPYFLVLTPYITVECPGFTTLTSLFVPWCLIRGYSLIPLPLTSKQLSIPHLSCSIKPPSRLGQIRAGIHHQRRKIFTLRREFRDALKLASLEWVLGIATKLASPGNLALRLEMIAERVDVKAVVACNPSRQLDHGHRGFDHNVFHYAVHYLSYAQLSPSYLFYSLSSES